MKLPDLSFLKLLSKKYRKGSENKKKEHQTFLMGEFDKGRILQTDNGKDNKEYLGKKK